MALTGTFSGSDTVTPQGVNAKLGGILGQAVPGLALKGVYSGGRLTVSGGSVSVTPFLAITGSGMTVTSTTTTVISLDSPPTTTPQYIICSAEYQAIGGAVISVYATHTIPADVVSSTTPIDYICLGIIGTYTSAPANANVFYDDPASIRDRDQVTPIGDSKFLGHYDTQANRNTAYPNGSTLAVSRIGDMTTYGTSESTFTISFWDGSSWQDFTNATQVAANLATHIADYTKHITLNQGAALAGSAGTPSGSNPFVTQADPGILGTAYVNSLVNALGTAPLSGVNPVISQSMVIAVPRVYQVGMPSTTNRVTLSATTLSISDFVVYLGKQGNTTYSSATQYFAIEDEYGNGYISTVTGLSVPVYVVDVCDHTGATSLNPSALTDAQGFYDVTAYESGNAITLILNTSVAVGVNLSVRMNVKGNMSAMSPNWPGTGSGSSFSPGNNFLPAITAFRQGKVSYVSALIGDFNTIVVGTQSGSFPNVQISTNVTAGQPSTVTQAFYAGPLSSGAVASWTVDVTGVGAVVAGTSTLFAPVQYINYDQTSPIGDGVKFSSAGVQSYQGIWVTDQAHITNYGGIDPNGRIMANQGSAAAPGYYFAGETSTGNTTTTSATTLVLTSASYPLQYFIGTSTQLVTQLVTLPDVTTLNINQPFIISNNSSSDVTVQSSGAVSVVVVAAGTSTTVTCISLTGTGAGSWSVGTSGSVIVPGTTVPTATGIYYIPAYSEAGSDAYNFDLFNGIGFSINGKTALFISRNGDTGPVTDMDCPLTLVQDYESTGSFMNYYLGIANVTGSGEGTVPGQISIGSWSNLSAFNAGLIVDIHGNRLTTPMQIQARNTTITNDEAFPAYSFNAANTTGIYYVDNWTNGDVATTTTSSTPVVLVASSPSLQLFTGSVPQTVTLPMASSPVVVGQIFNIANNSSANITVYTYGGYYLGPVVPGTVTAFTCIALTGNLVSAWSWVVTGPASTAGQYTNGIGFSLGGRTAFMIVQDQVSGDTGITAGAANPLILSQSNDGTYVYYNFAVAEQTNGELFPGAIRFGSIPYSGTFRSLLSVTTRTSSVDVTGYMTVTNRIITGSNSVLTRSSLIFNDYGAGITSTGTGNTLYVGNTGGAYVQVSGTNTDIYSPTATTVHGTSGTATFNVVNSSGSASVTGTVQTNNVGMFIGYGTVANDGTMIQWGIAAGTGNAYLSTSGKVFAKVDVSGPSYGFNGVNGVGMGVDLAGSLHLYGGTKPVVIDNATITTGSMTNLTLSGYLNAGSVVSTSSVSAVSGVFSGIVSTSSVSAVSGVFSGIVSVGSLSATGDIVAGGGASLQSTNSVVKADHRSSSTGIVISMFDQWQSGTHTYNLTVLGSSVVPTTTAAVVLPSYDHYGWDFTLHTFLKPIGTYVATPVTTSIPITAPAAPTPGYVSVINEFMSVEIDQRITQLDLNFQVGNGGIGTESHVSVYVPNTGNTAEYDMTLRVNVKITSTAAYSTGARSYYLHVFDAFSISNSFTLATTALSAGQTLTYAGYLRCLSFGGVSQSGYSGLSFIPMS